jgi:hypothetical protein
LRIQVSEGVPEFVRADDLDLSRRTPVRELPVS